MATINFIGLTGVPGTVTVTLATDTFDSLITAIAAEEGLPTDYYHVSLQRDPSKNDLYFADSSTPLTLDDASIGMIDGDTVVCTTAQENLTKQERQVQKLEIAQLKRKATFRDTGTYTDAEDAPYFRANNTYDLTSLPDTYNGNVPGPDDNPNPDGLLPKRPWISVSALTAPESIGEAVGGDTLVDLEIWYDGTDTATIVPTGIADEETINQWNDKSGLAHNLNFVGGGNKPTYESSSLQNTHEYVQFADGDLMSINPLASLSNASAYTVFVVARTTDISTNDPQILTSTDNDELSIRITSGGNAVFQAASGISATATSAVSENVWYVFTMVYNATNNIVGRVNDGSPPVASAGAVSGPANLDVGSTYLYVGGNSSGGTFIGDIGEIILFKRALNSTEYANVENYLTNKWGI